MSLLRRDTCSKTLTPPFEKDAQVSVHPHLTSSFQRRQEFGFVIPAEAGTTQDTLGSRLRGNDKQSQF